MKTFLVKVEKTMTEIYFVDANHIQEAAGKWRGTMPEVSNEEVQNIHVSPKDNYLAKSLVEK